ncbi:MAG: tetratricopeptide repeat protein [Planctomycetota bacterium]|nr:tetratricopeptide repeat protein [Planctomycetota bacterium]
MFRALSYIEKIAAVVLLLLAILLAYSAWKKARNANLIEDAVNYYNSSEMTLARDKTEEALKNSPDDTSLLAFRGETLFSQGYFTEAENSFKEAAARAPSNPSAVVGLASTLASQGRIEEADALLKGIETEEARLVKAAIAFKRDEIQTVQNLLSSLDFKNCSFNGVASFYLLNGLLALSQNRFEEALENAMRLIAFLPKSELFRPLSGHYNRLCLEAQRLITATAVRWLLSVKKEEVDIALAKVTALIDTRASERYGIAALWWQNMPQSYLLFLAGADALFRAGKYDESVKNYEKALKRLKGAKEMESLRDELELIIYLNAAYASKMQASVAPSISEKKQYLNQAADFYQKILAIRSATTVQKFEATILRANAYLEAESYRLAEEVLLQARAYGERLHIVDLNLAICCEKMKNYDKAIKWYENSLKYEENPFKETVSRRIEQLKEKKEKR